jgi:hypothetical protein
MNELHITNVEYLRNNMTKDITCNIDSPSICVFKNTNAINISGWAYCDNKKIKEISIMSMGIKIKSEKKNLPRRDVISIKSYLREESIFGFSMDVGVVGFPESIDIRVRAVFDDGSFTLIAKIIGKYTCEPYIVGLDKKIPILLNSMGRMGTTMLMRLIKSHPSIVTTNNYPYEERPSQYWTHMFKVLAEPGNYEESVNTDQFFSTNYYVGNNPFYTLNKNTSSWYNDHYLGILGNFINNAINEYYNDQALWQGKQAEMYIEKMMSPNSSFWDIYNRTHPGVKNIFLVRDIRDVYCSVLDFNKKRGYMSFGVQQSMTEEEYIHLLERQYSALFSRWEAESTNSILVKYEDILLDVHGEIKKILDYLGVNSDKGVVDNMVAEAAKMSKSMASHQTSTSPENSIGRWKKDLEPNLAMKANDKFKDTLDSFGYSSS